MFNIESVKERLNDLEVERNDLENQINEIDSNFSFEPTDEEWQDSYLEKVPLYQELDEVKTMFADYTNELNDLINTQNEKDDSSYLL